MVQGALEVGSTHQGAPGLLVRPGGCCSPWAAPWYVSNVSIIYEAFMLFYYLFWMITGFIVHFYITFGTNLLTGGPACCFIACFRISKKRNIKWSPNGMKPSGTWFSQRTRPRRLGPYVKASPLSSTSIGNFTWSYIFIRHMICVFLGASFYFDSFCLMLVRIMFCIFRFNNKVKHSYRCQNRRISGRGSRTVRLGGW